MLTGRLQNLSVNLTSSPGWCERVLNSLSLSEACTLSLHQDELSKMEDERALAAKGDGKCHLWWTRLEPESLRLIWMLCQGWGDGECVFHTLIIISIVEMLRHGCFRGFTSYLNHSRENPYFSWSFPLLNPPPCFGIANHSARQGNQIIYVLNRQASYKNKVETRGIWYGKARGKCFRFAVSKDSGLNSKQWTYLQSSLLALLISQSIQIQTV